MVQRGQVTLHQSLFDEGRILVWRFLWFTAVRAGMFWGRASGSSGSSCTGTGAAAGAVNGLFGAGGGMLLLPLLHRLTDLREHEAFACSVCTMLPLSVVSLVVYWLRGGEFLPAALPYLAGGALGGIAAGLLLRRLSAVWLHRALGALIVWGGRRRLLR